jgi:hypothetical protein
MMSTTTLRRHLLTSASARGRAPQLIIASALAALVHGNAHAQEANAPGQRKVEVGLAASATYDSNVARGDQAVGDVRVIRPGDYIYQPSATIDAFLPIGRNDVFVKGHVGYEFYQHNSNLNSENIDLSGGGHASVGPCGVAMTSGIARRQSDLADLALNVNQNKELDFTAGVNLQCGTPGGLGATVGYQYGRTTNSSPQVPNSNTSGVNVGVVYASEMIGKLNLTGGYSTSGYEETPNSIFGTPSGNQQYNVTLSIDRAIGRRLSGQASIAYTSEKSDDPRTRDFSGVTGSGLLTYKINPRLDATLSYRRGLTNSLQEGIDYVLDQSVQLNFAYRMTSRVQLSLGGAIDHRNFEGLATQTLGVVNDDRISNVNGAVTVQVGRRSSLTFSAQYEDRTANPSQFSYTGYRLGVAAATTF